MIKSVMLHFYEPEASRCIPHIIFSGDEDSVCVVAECPEVGGDFFYEYDERLCDDDLDNNGELPSWAREAMVTENYDTWHSEGNCPRDVRLFVDYDE